MVTVLKIVTGNVEAVKDLIGLQAVKGTNPLFSIKSNVGRAFGLRGIGNTYIFF